MKITIDTHNCSREELAELKGYLENNSWDFKTDEKEEEKEPTYALREDGLYVVGSHKVVLNEKISDEELHEFYIIDRKDFIDELIGWISEAKNDKELMKQDLDMLMKRTDDFMFSSNSTNDYIGFDDSRFDETCKELIELSESLD